jgi:hypothetical protein
LVDAAHHRGSIVHLDVRTHALELGTVHEALRENRVLDHADPRGGCQQGGHLRLHVGRITGIGRGDQIHPTGGIAGAADRAHVPRLVEFHPVAGLFDRHGDGLEVIAADAAEDHVIPRHGGGRHEGAGLDAIRNHGVLDPVQLADSLDDNPAGAGPADFRPHRVEEIRKVQHLRFGGGGLDHGHSLGKRGRHHDIVGAKHRRSMGAAQVDLRAAKTLLRGQQNVASGKLDLGTERLKPAQMQVHRAVANDTSAGQ